MMQTTGICPYCKKKLSNYNEREWKYGSPIRTCTKCGEKYIDKRYHEIVIEGIAPDAMSVKKDLVAIIIGLIAIIISATLTFTTIQLNGSYSLKGVAIGFIGLFLVIAMLIDLIRIKTGLKERRFAVLRVESAKRLQDKTYAHQLLSAGYNVPEEYL